MGNCACQQKFSLNLTFKCRQAAINSQNQNVRNYVANKNYIITGLLSDGQSFIEMLVFELKTLLKTFFIALDAYVCRFVAKSFDWHQKCNKFPINKYIIK